jgi:hypothetical protein
MKCNKAIKKSTGKLIYAITLKSAKVQNIHDFKCQYCGIDLTLSSFKKNNIPKPYFKQSKVGEENGHKKYCKYYLNAKNSTRNLEQENKIDGSKIILKADSIDGSENKSKYKITSLRDVNQLFHKLNEEDYERNVIHFIYLKYILKSHLEDIGKFVKNNPSLQVVFDKEVKNDNIKNTHVTIKDFIITPNKIKKDKINNIIYGKAVIYLNAKDDYTICMKEQPIFDNNKIISFYIQKELLNINIVNHVNNNLHEENGKKYSYCDIVMRVDSKEYKSKNNKFLNIFPKILSIRFNDNKNIIIEISKKYNKKKSEPITKVKKKTAQKKTNDNEFEERINELENQINYLSNNLISCCTHNIVIYLLNPHNHFLSCSVESALYLFIDFGYKIKPRFKKRFFNLFNTNKLSEEYIDEFKNNYYNDALKLAKLNKKLRVLKNNSGGSFGGIN